MKPGSEAGLVAAEEEGLLQSQAVQILCDLARNGAATAQEVGERTKLGAYTVSKRRGGLLRSGCVEEMAARACQVTGRKAQPLRITDTGHDAIECGDVPRPGPSRRDRELHALSMARDLAAFWREQPEIPPALKRLVDAMWNLDHIEARHRGGVAAPREPWGSPLRPALAAQGVWLRQNGDRGPITQLNDHHLQGAINWCKDNGAEDNFAPLYFLLLEHQRRFPHGQVSPLP